MMASDEMIHGAAPPAVADFFDRKVDEWQKRSEDVNDYWSRRVAFGAEFLARHLPPHARCLDIGCATGPFSALLHRQGCEVYGVDVAEAMVQAARRRMAALGVPEARFTRCEGESLPFEDETFDLVSALDVLPYVQNHPPYLRELRRVLKPGGLAFVTITNPRSLFVYLHLLKRVFTCIPGGRYIVPGRWWWRQNYHLIRTGYWSGGLVDLSRAVQARSAASLDRFFRGAGFDVVDGFNMYYLRRLDRHPLGRKRFSAWAARRWGWNHFGLYAKTDSSRA
jgi:ubiquinone/menaquinone biosynthesis C-methylase UbiE